MDLIKPTLPLDTTISFSDVTSSGFTVSWKAASDNVTDASKLRYQILCYEVPGTMVTSRTTDMGVTRCTFSGLRPNTQHCVYIMVYDENKNYSAYPIVSQKTDVMEPDTRKPSLPSDTTISFSNVTNNGFTVSWKTAYDTVTVPSKLRYDVYWRESSARTTTPLRNGVTGTTCTLSGLKTATEYDVWIWVYDETGNSSQYPLQVQKTSGLVFVDSRTPGLPSDTRISFSNVTDNSFTVSWKAASDNATVASKLRYQVICCEISGMGTFPNPTSVNVIGVMSHTFSGLKSGSEYCVFIAVYDENNNYSLYPTVSQKTSGPAPDTTNPNLPSDSIITASNVTDSGFTVSWKTASDNETVASKLRYEVLWYEVIPGVIIYVPNTIDIKPAKVMSHTLSGLKAGTDYCVYIGVFDENRNTSYYPQIIQKTNKKTAILKEMRQ